MRNQKLLRIVSALVLVLLVAFAAVGCNNQDKPEGTEPVTSEPAVNEETAPSDTLEAPVESPATEDTQESAPATSDEAVTTDDAATTDGADATTTDSAATDTPEDTTSAAPEDTTTAQ